MQSSTSFLNRHTEALTSKKLLKNSLSSGLPASLFGFAFFATSTRTESGPATSFVYPSYSDKLKIARKLYQSIFLTLDKEKLYNIIYQNKL